MSGIPLQQDCDPEDPYEFALWALICLPGLEDQAAMIVPPQTLRTWSRRLREAGFRHHPELQEIKYVPPQGGEHWLDSAAGHWVPIDQPLPPETTAPDTSHLSEGELRVLGARLKDQGYVPADEPESVEWEDQASVEEVTDHGD